MDNKIALNDPEYTEEKASIICAEDDGDLELILRELAKIQAKESDVAKIEEKIINCSTTTNQEYDKIIETFEFFEEEG